MGTIAAVSTSSDLDRAKASISHVVREHLGPEARITDLRPLHGGACQDNVRVDIDAPEGPLRLVVRSDAPSSIPGTLDRQGEFAVLEAAVAAGVATPAARWLTRDLLRDDAWAYFLDWAEGVAIGRKVLKEPALADARAALPAQLAVQAARIHAVTPATAIAGLEPVDDPVTEGLAVLRTLIDRLDRVSPAIEFVFRWLAENPPPSREVTLVHGDFRTGNFMVGPGGLEAVLDWEFARWSSPFEDLAWISVRDWRFGRLDRPIGGFGQRQPFYDAYTEASGRAVDLRDVHWWEVNGNLRWAVGCVFQAQRYAAGQRDLELLAIGRRWSEMAYEALRLIERGVEGL